MGSNLAHVDIYGNTKVESIGIGGLMRQTLQVGTLVPSGGCPTLSILPRLELAVGLTSSMYVHVCTTTVLHKQVV